MKRVISAVFGVALLAVSFAAHATVQSNSKVASVLDERNCSRQAVSLPEKITKLKIELAHGDKVHTPEEARQLKGMLKEAENTMHELLEPGK
jgi:hypothetical protein